MTDCSGRMGISIFDDLSESKRLKPDYEFFTFFILKTSKYILIVYKTNSINNKKLFLAAKDD